MTLGTEVGLGPGYILLDWDPFLLWPNGWMDQDDTWHRGGPWSRLHSVRLGPISVVAKPLDASRCQSVCW